MKGGFFEDARLDQCHDNLYVVNPASLVRRRTRGSEYCQVVMGDNND